MDNISKIRLELGINAQRYIQQIEINNQFIEDQISKGIELALDDIANSDNFIQMIRQNTVSELRDIVNKAVMSWEIRNKISKMVEEKIGEKLNAYADKIADRIVGSLE